VDASLEASVREWIDADPDPNTQRELQDLLAASDEHELRQRFAAPLSFGTAGLRGPVRAGPSGMNQMTVRRATEGVAAWLQSLGDEICSRGVVIGRDARHGSEEFFAVAISTLQRHGIDVFAFDRPLPTPLVAFAVRHLHAAAGIMITASHNPPADNGYKLYDADGSQIISPVDTLVEQYAAQSPLRGCEADETGVRHVLGDETVEQYVAHITERFCLDSPSSLRIAYTALHGVGESVALRALNQAGFTAVHSVARQREPDGDFPTLPFPNPEEPGAMDMVLDLARSSEADLVIANDPDADRLGVAIIDGEQWRTLRGDEIGWLLADAILERGVRSDQVLATTIVSSSMMRKMAEANNVSFVETLTGFKWISRAGWSRGATLAFGYEEALGFAVDSAVADKDGVSAAVALARRAHDLAIMGVSLARRLEHLAATYGPHEVGQISLRAEGPDARAKITRAVERLRDAPPHSLGGLGVSEVVDLATGYHGLAPTDGLLLRLGDVARVVVRPSGTEPKLKAYLEVTGTPVALERLASSRSEVRLRFDAVRRDLAAHLSL
jgi:phosphomannomutase